MAKLKGDFEALSLAIANLPVGLIPFPDVAKASLQKLNADVVHGVTSGSLDIEAIAADREAVAAALGGLGSEGGEELLAIPWHQTFVSLGPWGPCFAVRCA